MKIFAALLILGLSFWWLFRDPPQVINQEELIAELKGDANNPQGLNYAFSKVSAANDKPLEASADQPIAEVSGAAKVEEIRLRLNEIPLSESSQRLSALREIQPYLYDAPDSIKELALAELNHTQSEASEAELDRLGAAAQLFLDSGGMLEEGELSSLIENQATEEARQKLKAMFGVL